MGLRDIEAKLPPGYRFYPSDEELVCHYLYKKISNQQVSHCTLVEIDLHTCEPWQLPEVAKVNSNEWYFFSNRDRKYATGYRTNRATTCGYWKATGKDRRILHPTTRTIFGLRKTLVFYHHRAPNGVKTGWIMHEFRLQTNPYFPPKEDWVLCRVFHKSKSGGINGDDNIHDNDKVISTTGAAASSSSSPAVDASLPSGYSPITGVTASNAVMAAAHTKREEHVVDDEYGFFFYVNSQNFNIQADGGVPSCLEDFRFDGGDELFLI